MRYSQARPSLKRVPQFRADIIAVLLCTSGNIDMFSTQTLSKNVDP